MIIEPEAIDGEMEEFLRCACPADEQDAIDAQLDRMTGGNDDGIAEDAVCGAGYDDENRYEGDDCPLDGDATSALASCGWGTDEDYGCYDGGGDEW
jgi:hypothetical protein